MSKKKDKKPKSDASAHEKTHEKKGKKSASQEKSARPGCDKIPDKNPKEKKHKKEKPLKNREAQGTSSGKKHAGKKKAQDPSQKAALSAPHLAQNRDPSLYPDFRPDEMPRNLQDRKTRPGQKAFAAPQAQTDVSALFSQIEKDAVLSREIEALPLNLSGCVLHPSEIRSLRTVRDSEPVNLTGLARQLEITKTGASKNITKLLEKGLVEKETRPNRREVLFTLTPKGRQCAGSIEDSIQALYEPVRKLLTACDVTLLTDFFSRLEVVLTGILDEKQIGYEKV